MYESRAYDNEHGDPVVVLVVTGTHDVSRFVNAMSGRVATVELMVAGDKIARQVRRHSGGQAALKLLAAHGGPDLSTDATEDADSAAEIARLTERLRVAEAVCVMYGISPSHLETEREKAAYEVWLTWAELVGHANMTQHPDLSDERIAELARQRDAKRDDALARIREASDL